MRVAVSVIVAVLYGFIEWRYINNEEKNTMTRSQMTTVLLLVAVAPSLAAKKRIRLKSGRVIVGEVIEKTSDPSVRKTASGRAAAGPGPRSGRPRPR